MTTTDLLLYPMGEATDLPVCAECGFNMTLAKFEAQRGSPVFSTFRCADCGHSETFLAEPDDIRWPAIPF